MFDLMAIILTVFTCIMFVLLVKCDGKEVRIGDIALSLPAPAHCRNTI